MEGMLSSHHISTKGTLANSHSITNGIAHSHSRINGIEQAFSSGAAASTKTEV